MNATYQICKLLSEQNFDIKPIFKLDNPEHQIIGNKENIMYIAKISDINLKDRRFNTSIQHIIKKNGIIVDQQSTNYIRETEQEYIDYGKLVAKDLNYFMYRNRIL
jgi:hypothetical protein